MRVIAITLVAVLLAAGAAYAATSLLDNASDAGDDPVGNLSPVGSVGSERTATEDRTTRTEDDGTTTDETTTEDSTTEGTTTDDHGGGSGNSGSGGSGSGNSGHGGGDDD